MAKDLHYKCIYYYVLIAVCLLIFSSSHGFVDWMFTTVRCWGESPKGVWSVRVFDYTDIGPQSDGKSRGTLVQWRLILRGANMTKDDIVKRRK